jgi:hypothetical protein
VSPLELCFRPEKAVDANIQPVLVTILTLLKMECKLRPMRRPSYVPMPSSTVSAFAEAHLEGFASHLK